MTYRLTNVRVLVVDDNPPIRMLMRTLLLDLGIGMVDMASNPQQGWDSFRQFHHDMIFLDWPAGNAQALDFLKQIRCAPDSPLPDVPVIIVTGYSEASRVRQARDAGASDMLIKPFTMTCLVNHLIHLIESRHAFVRTPQFVGPDRRRRISDVQTDRRSFDSQPLAQ